MEWKVISDNPKYEISSSGLVRIIETQRIMNPTINSKGYYRASWKINNQRYRPFIHRLVAEAFIENTENLPEIDHIDRNPKNNCVENLRWTTRLDNMANLSMRKDNKIGFKNIVKSGNRFHWRFKRDGVFHFGKNFDTPEEAYTDYLTKFPARNPSDGFNLPAL